MFAAYVRVNVAVRSVVQIVVHHVEYLVACLSLEEDVQVEVLVSHRHRYAEDEVGQRRTEISAVLSGDASVVVQVFEAEVSGQGGLLPVVLSGVILTGGGANLRNIEAQFRRISRIEKIKIAKMTQFTLHGDINFLKNDGTQSTLLGLLAKGNENCCKPVEVETSTIKPTISSNDLFKDDENLKKQEEEMRKKQEEEARRKQEERERREREKAEKEKKNGWFQRTFKKMSKDIFDDTDTEMK